MLKHNSLMEVIDRLIDLADLSSSCLLLGCLCDGNSDMFHLSWICNWLNRPIFRMLKQAIVEHALHLAMHVLISHNFISKRSDLRLHSLHLCESLFDFGFLSFCCHAFFFDLKL